MTSLTTWDDDDPELVTLLRPIESLKRRRQKYRAARVMAMLHKRHTRRRGVHDWAAREVVHRAFMNEIVAKMKAGG